MAYGYKRKRAYRRPMTTRKRRARKIARVSTVKRMISRAEETKWRQVANNGVVTGLTNPDLLQLNGLTKGTSRDNRVGNRVTYTSVDSYITLTAFSSSSSAPFSRIRLLLFIDKNANGTLPTPSELFAGVGSIDTATMMTPLNPDLWPRRFKLLKDRIVTVGQQGGFFVGNISTSEEKTIRFRRSFKFRAQFNDNNFGTYQDFVSGTLYLLCLSDEINAQAPTCTVRTVIKFKDA